jgi:hypothetical protein
MYFEPELHPALRGRADFWLYVSRGYPHPCNAKLQIAFRPTASISALTMKFSIGRARRK